MNNNTETFTATENVDDQWNRIMNGAGENKTGLIGSVVNFITGNTDPHESKEEPHEKPKEPETPSVAADEAREQEQGQDQDQGQDQEQEQGQDQEQDQEQNGGNLEIDYKEKYLKYKQKYLELKKLL